MSDSIKLDAKEKTNHDSFLALINAVDVLCRKGEAISYALSNSFNGDCQTPLNDDIMSWALLDIAAKFEEIRELAQAHHEAQKETSEKSSDIKKPA